MVLTKTTGKGSRINIFPGILCSVIAIPFLLLSTYVVSIVWRVSIAENQYFGRSELIPLVLPARKFNAPAVAGSFGHPTYAFTRPEGKVIVWRQKINGFQHVYGSALASFEIGGSLAKKLFCLNELAEFTCDWNGVELSDLLDRKKDLANNELGRAIGTAARKARIPQKIAESFIARECAIAVESNPRFIPHYLDARVLSLSERELGCDCLPTMNLFTRNEARIPSLLQPPVSHSPCGWKQKDFLISYCCEAPANETSIVNAKSQCFNLIPAWQETLDFAQKHNVKIMLEHGLLHPTTVHSAEKLKQLDGLISKLKNHPGLGAYYVFDEPQSAAFHDVAVLVEFLRKRDPYHLAFVNMLPIYGVPGKLDTDPSITYLQFLRQYIDSVKPELLSYDYYNFYRNKDGTPYDLPGYFVNLGLIRQAAIEAHIPFMNIIQASTFLKEYRLPTASEMRWQVYTTLAYGARGINYFLYWGPKSYGGLYQDGKETELLKPVVQLNKEIAALGPELMNLETVNVYHTAPQPPGATAFPEQSPVRITSSGEFIIGFFSSKGKQNTFMIVNRDYKHAATAKLRIPGKDTIEEFDREKTAWRTHRPEAGENFAISLDAGDGKLFRY